MGVGVDWANGGWVAVSVDSGVTSVETVDSFDLLYERVSDSPILVDIPIGLVSAGTDDDSRECDSLARSVLGSRSASVFSPPCREALRRKRDGAEHGPVSERNREITGKGLSIQSYHISEAIAAVDNFLQSTPEALGTVRGSHPEVCFRALADEPLSASKTSAQGFGQRLAALDTVSDAPERDVRAAAEALEDEDAGADIDDVLDALALAHVANAPSDELQTLPEAPPADETGLPMEIVYRADEPFDLV